MAENNQLKPEDSAFDVLDEMELVRRQGETQDIEDERESLQKAREHESNSLQGDERNFGFGSLHYGESKIEASLEEEKSTQSALIELTLDDEESAQPVSPAPLKLVQEAFLPTDPVEDGAGAAASQIRLETLTTADPAPAREEFTSQTYIQRDEVDALTLEAAPAGPSDGEPDPEIAPVSSSRAPAEVGAEVDRTEINEDPTDLALSNDTVAENDEGAIVGTLTALDPDAGDNVSFSIVEDPSELFEVVGSQLKLKDGASLDHEDQDAYEIKIETTDSVGNNYQEIVKIDVADINETPTDITLSNNIAAENDAGAVVGTLAASDPDAGDSVSFSIAEDPSGLFEIVGSQLKLKDGASLDHEDQDAYEIKIETTDSAGNSYQETVTINVADVNEAPTDITLSNDIAAENDAGAVVATLAASDPDAGDNVSFSIAEDPSGLFEIAGSQLKLKDGASLDHEDQDAHEIAIETTDSAGNSYQETVTINVADVNEAPTDITLSNNIVAENEAGATVGTLGASDPDEGAAVEFAVSDDRFEVVETNDGFALKLKSGVSLDYEAESRIDIAVTATDEHGESASADFSIAVTDIDEGPVVILGTNAADILQGTVDGEMIYGLAGDDQILGDAGDDTILGGLGNDNITGGAGADELLGGAGNDRIYADSDDTVVSGGGGLDQVIVQGAGDFSIDMAASEVEAVAGGSGDDAIDASGMTSRAVQVGNGGDDTLTGGAGDDVQQGGAGDDIISGGAGDDSIEGGAGADALTGGAGDDTLYADSDDTVVSGGDGLDQVIVQGAGDFSIDMAASEVEAVAGGSGDDVIDASGATGRVVQTGNEGDDALTGGAADDIQQGGDGDDTILGGAGDDSIVGGDGADALSGGAGDDTLYADSDDTVVSGGDGFDQVMVDGAGDFSIDMAASEVEAVDGGAGNDAIDASGMTEQAIQVGRAGDDTILGGSGDDIQHGGSGDDTIFGGAGDDSIEGGAGADVLSGGDGDDTLYADSDDTVVSGGDGVDQVTVQGSGDFSIDMAASEVEGVEGGSGNDAIDASGMTEQAIQFGKEGADTLTGGAGDDIQHGGDGDDVILGGGGDDIQYGGAGDDSILGRAGDDTLSGDEGDDLLRGGKGDDTISGGEGDDTLTGGEDSDVFVYGIGDGSDEINGGDGAWTDTIQFEGGVSSLGEYGVDWTLQLTEGSVVSVGPDGIQLSDNADGVITILDDGSTIDFVDMEQII